MIVFRSFETADFEPLREFLASAGFGERVSDEGRFRAMIDGADRTVLAFDDGRVVGFARALCSDIAMERVRKH
jgi:hypothetical protein